MRTLNLTGNTFGRLTVIRRSGTDQRNKKVLWLCRCNCGGSLDLLEVSTGNLRSGNTKSCGCYNRDTSAAIGRKYGGQRASLTHGHAPGERKSPTYNSWRGMKDRCTNPKNSHWRYYGDAGVTVCDRWQSFENFLADMGERPPGKTLDRYPDNCGNYEPGNCRWATPSQQKYNQRKRA